MEGELETQFEILAIRTAFRAQWVNGSPACMPEFLMSSNFFSFAQHVYNFLLNEF